MELNEIVKGQKFDIVHCFDVLYHLVDSIEWEKSVENLGKVSRRFILIHDKPNYWHNLLEPKHVKVKRGTKIEDILKKYGFKLINSYPTHFFYVKSPFHFIVKYVPLPFYFLDRLLLTNFINLRGFESHHIKVFEKDRI